VTANIHSFFDPVSGTVSYVLSDSGEAAVIDSVLDFDKAGAWTSTESADRIVDYVRARGLTVCWILETHAHADHLSAASYLKTILGGRLAMGAQIREVQRIFKQFYNLGSDFPTDGTPFDHLFDDGETFRVGASTITALRVPGHTPADMAYQVDSLVFTGDTLFMPDVGTARADFPGGSARTLYQSIQRLLRLPESTRLMHCHDYPPNGREPSWESSVGAQRAANIHAHDGVSEAQFVALRQARDASLPPPDLILPAVQINIRAGALPPAEDNGVSYLRIPVNVLQRPSSSPNLRRT
jgi:glyoxylase-like metal-dependent hydrolase (beta-lactamase superfamily II)